MPVDQDVEQEAEMVETYLEKLREENPLVLREVSKVKSDVSQKQRPLLWWAFRKEAAAGSSRRGC